MHRPLHDRWNLGSGGLPDKSLWTQTICSQGATSSNHETISSHLSHHTKLAVAGRHILRRARRERLEPATCPADTPRKDPGHPYTFDQAATPEQSVDIGFWNVPAVLIP
jgi:hypothetical protein